jgi:DNA-directed RNA polymerase specialized sigma24 family protein
MSFRVAEVTLTVRATTAEPTGVRVLQRELKRNRSTSMQLRIEDHVLAKMLPPSLTAGKTLDDTYQVLVLIGEAESLGLLQLTFLALLRPGERDILLRSGRGDTHEEMARDLGLPDGTVRSRLHRARERLRELVDADALL